MAELEVTTIQPVPKEARHGRVRDLFTLWFSANMQITTIATGAILGFLGLSLPWIVVALIVGNLIGATFMSFHSVQGPRIGVPQMIQSRAQFGFIAAILPIAVVLFSYVGFWASSAVLGGEAIAYIIHGGVLLGIAVVFLLTTILTIYGYDTIHRYQRYMAWLFGAAFLVWTISFLASGSLTAKDLAQGGFQWGTFLLAVSIPLSWQITYSVAVSDYSRYLPADTKAHTTFWTTLSGTTIATVWMMLIGALLTFFSTKLDQVTAIGTLSGSLAWFMMLIMVLGVVAANVINSYGGMLCIDTIVGTFKELGRSQTRRTTLIILVGIAGGALAVLGQGNFLTNLTNFILFLLYLAVPWSAINLVDFYLIRHGNYDPVSFVRAGTYGSVNWVAIIAYLVGFGVELPFMDSVLYEGPIAKAMGGADISWIPGIIVAGGIYYLVMHARTRSSVAATPSASPPA